jgi:acetate kinase
MTSIAVINAGSSSIKLAVYDRAMHPTLLLRGQIEGLGTRPRARLSDAHGKVLSEESFSDSNFDHDQATRGWFALATSGSGNEASPRSGTGSSMAGRTILRHCL